MALLSTKDFNSVVEFSKKIKKLIVITRGENGAMAIHDNKVEESKAKKI